MFFIHGPYILSSFPFVRAVASVFASSPLPPQSSPSSTGEGEGGSPPPLFRSSFVVVFYRRRQFCPSFNPSSLRPFPILPYILLSSLGPVSLSWARGGREGGKLGGGANAIHHPTYLLPTQHSSFSPSNLSFVPHASGLFYWQCLHPLLVPLSIPPSLLLILLSEGNIQLLCSRGERARLQNRTDYYYTGHNRPLGKAGRGTEEEGKRRSAGFGRGRRAGGGLRPISLSLFPLPTTNQPADGRRCLPLSSADCWFSGLWANSSGLERHPPPPPLLCTTTPSFPLAVAVESGRRKKRKPLSRSLAPSLQPRLESSGCVR